MTGHARREATRRPCPSGRPGVAGPTAHPAAEAWQEERFARLQQRLVAATTAARRGASRRSVVVLPSRSVDRWHEPPAETRSYEERLLSFLLDLRDPALEMTYVSSLPVAQRTIDYYVSLSSPRLCGGRRGGVCGSSRWATTVTGPLARSCSNGPGYSSRSGVRSPIRSIAYLMPYNSTGLERDVALALDIPLFGADPEPCMARDQERQSRAVRHGRSSPPAGGRADQDDPRRRRSDLRAPGGEARARRGGHQARSCSVRRGKRDSLTWQDCRCPAQAGRVG